MRKAAAWYAKGLYGANALRQRIWKIRDPGQVMATVEDYFGALRVRETSVAA